MNVAGPVSAFWRALRRGGGRDAEGGAAARRPLLSSTERAMLVRLSEERARAAPPGALAGGEQAVNVRGPGLDFQELRRYEQGDDVRAMDWRTTARTGVPHVRVYRQERRRCVYLVVDLGPGMRFGTHVRLKAAQAARAAVLIALQCTREGGAVGAAMLGAPSAPHSSGETVRLWPIRTGRRHALALAETLAAPCPPLPMSADAVPAEFGHALAALGRQLPLGAELILLSDFRWLDESHIAALHRLRSSGRSVRGIRITDAVERTLPQVGRAPFCAFDDSAPIWLDTSRRAVREAFEARADAAGARCRERLAAAGASYVEVSADASAEDLLRRLDEPRAEIHG